MSESSLHLEETETPPELEPDQEGKFEIINYPADTTLKGFYDQWKSEQLIIPRFQRGYVWDIKRASKLIESFLLGLPVPNVFLYKRKNEAGYLIIDGQQRITSIVRYLDQEFDDKRFRLRSVAERFENKSLMDLPDDIRFQLENTVLRAIIIQQLSPDDDTAIYKIFERLNTGGINLNPMEVRQSIADTYFIDMLKEVNEDQSWRKILGIGRPDKRLKDVELILRVMALRGSYENYEKPMKGYLTSFSEQLRDHKEVVDNYRVWFKDTVECVFDQLGEKPFHYRGRINYGVIDAVLSTRPDGVCPADLAARFETLKNDAQFDIYVTSDTSDTAVVRSRLQLSKATLWE